MKYLTSMFAGLLFAVGLGISGMMSPSKVMNFLDLFGTWDPSLAFVMGGALVLGLIMFPLVLKRHKPVCEDIFNVPTNKTIDYKLILGSVSFGVGWAIAGVCPGPALANISSLNPTILLFVVVMLTTMYITKIIRKE